MTLGDGLWRSLAHLSATQYIILSVAIEGILFLIAATIVIARTGLTWHGLLRLSFLSVVLCGAVPSVIFYAVVKIAAPDQTGIEGGLFLGFPANIISIVTLFSMMAWLALVGTHGAVQHDARQLPSGERKYTTPGYLGCFAHALACFALTNYGQYLRLDG